MDFSLQRRLLFCLLPIVALGAWCNASMAIANERSPVYRYFPLENADSGRYVVALTETSDGVLFICCRQKKEVLFFDGNNWEEITLPSPPRALVADQNDRVWVSMTTGLGFIDRDAMGAVHFHQFDLQERESDPVVFPVGFKTDKGVRFGNSRLIADIDCSNSEAKVSLYRCRQGEKFNIKDGNVIYSYLEGKNQLFQWNNGERSAVATEFLPNGIFGCQLSDNRYLFISKEDREFKIKRGDKWQGFFQNFKWRPNGVPYHWFQPLSKNRIGFASPKSFTCCDDHGKPLWSLNQAVNRFGELSDGRIWISGVTGFYIMDPAENVSRYSIEPKTDRHFHSIDVIEEGILLCNSAGLFFMEMDKGKGTFPKLKNSKKLLSDPTFMTWDSGDSKLAATSLGVVRLQEPAKTGFDKPIAFGFTTSDQRYLFARAQGEVNVLDAEMKLKATFALPFNPVKMIEISPTKFWHFGKGGRFAETEFDSEFLTCNVRMVDGLIDPSTVTELDGQLYFVTENGLFSPTLKPKSIMKRLSLELKEAGDQFSKLNDLFRKRSIKRVIDCDDFGLLLCDSNHFTLHKFEDGQYQSEPYVQWTVPGEVGRLIHWDPHRSVAWATSGKGLVALLPQPGKPHKSFPPVLKMAITPQEAIQVSSGNDRLTVNSDAEISFNFGMPNALEATTFQYRLLGLDEDWSDWTKSEMRKYERLPSGKYHFEVRARGANGELVSTSSKEFSVKKPWYATNAAIIMFTLLGIGLIFGASSLRAKQLAARNKKMERLIAIRTDEIQKQKKEIEEKSDLLITQYHNAESEKLKSFDTLVAGISHDFNNLLAVISTNCESIGIKFGQPSEELTENMQTAIESAADLCGELSAISDTRNLKLEKGSLRGVVEEIMPVIQGSVPSDVNLEFDLCETPTGVLIDFAEMKRAILNLVVNAAEFAEHQILIETSVSYLSQARLQEARFIGDCPPPSDFANISISDDGPGIKSEYLGRLFDPFFTTNDLGRGLGLSIVMRVLARHNGAILVEKSEMGGARFQLCLPLIDHDHVEPAKLVKPKRINDAKFKVLLVDDNAMVLQSTSIVVESLGHEVLTANSAAKGLEILKQIDDIDVLVLDIAMPEMSGVEMAEIVLKEDPDFPIVFVSGFNNEKIHPSLLQLPNVDFLNKPYRFPALNEKISQASASRKKSLKEQPQSYQQPSALH